MNEVCFTQTNSTRNTPYKKDSSKDKKKRCNTITGIHKHALTVRQPHQHEEEPEDEMGDTASQGHTSDSIQTTPMNEVRFMVDCLSYQDYSTQENEENSAEEEATDGQEETSAASSAPASLPA
jgi:hypothetical protein